MPNNEIRIERLAFKNLLVEGDEITLRLTISRPDAARAALFALHSEIEFSAVFTPQEVITREARL